jgi:hypothetical protein
MEARLYPTLPLAEHETPTSFVSRLARLHRSGSARMFCTDLGFTFQSVIDGEPSKLAYLARISGATERTLVVSATQREDKGWRLHGQLLLKSSMQRTSVRVCPACIGEDLKSASLNSVYGRVSWQIVSIRTCATHGMAILAAVQPPRPQMTHDFAVLIAPEVERVAALAQDATLRPISAFETYLLRRLEGVTGEAPWLDDLEFAAAARICEVIGAVALRGREPKIAKMSEDDWQVAGQVGFAIAFEGTAAVCTWLSELQATYDYTRFGTEGPQAIYGGFYKFLAFQAKDPIFDSIRDLVREHIVATMPVGAGEEILGKPVKQRRLHSVYTASQQTGLHPKRLSKLLAGAGLIDTEVNFARQVFAAEKLNAIAGEADAISQQQVADYLNAGRVQTQLLVDHKFIVALPVPEGAVPRYSKASLDAFIAKLLRDAIAVKFPKLPICTIPAAAKRANCSATEVLELIINRQLAWVGHHESARGYLSVLVNADEIRNLTRGEALDGFTAREIEKDLKTTTRVVTALISGGHLIQVDATNPVNRCPVKIVRTADYERFKQTYVSLFGLMRETGKHFRTLKARLTAAGVKPTLPASIYYTDFYRRADVVGL